MQASIAFIGVGNMAGAIIRGLIQNGYPADLITGTARSEEKRQAFTQELGINMTDDNNAAVAEADVVVLCVKPAQMADVIAGFKSVISPDQVYLSVAAGLGLESLSDWLGDVAIVRSMPNTPAQLGSGMTGLIANDKVTDAHKDWVTELFASVGDSLWVEDEKQMHTVTALSGSAPAYFFRFLEAMIKSGQTQGLDEASCRKLASYTMLGAARMVTETSEDISQLRKNITSPNGTTEQALNSFEASDIDLIVDQAMQACINRSNEMATLFASTTENKDS
ncbi:pyrroline-5-carboxylate reductase [Marinomonas sp. S3726]|uniref:pyrroline-5-carboxylate reductase n=1 Tax=Marinomonas sp. S3726 TaxID=579484 RepID=UPI0005FA2DDD|nr:pyrroline-5-carboxylate reductase [Marinomonas sp. S3726]KJZ15795.1 pyrroline-5-carboxylate reductase [Marinomonas sp. S3726]